MWPFRKKALPPEVTNDSYARWLRAQRPPWLWFLGLDEETQEQLAIIGDEDRQDFAIAIGHAVQDPATADAALGAARGDVDSEVTLARKVALDLVGRMARRSAPAPQTPPEPPYEPQPLSMGGLSERQADRESERADAKHVRRTLFGQPPDEATA